jgi:hypothetical protein
MRVGKRPAQVAVITKRSCGVVGAAPQEHTALGSVFSQRCLEDITGPGMYCTWKPEVGHISTASMLGEESDVVVESKKDASHK